MAFSIDGSLVPQWCVGNRQRGQGLPGNRAESLTEDSIPAKFNRLDRFSANSLNSGCVKDLRSQSAAKIRPVPPALSHTRALQRPGRAKRIGKENAEIALHMVRRRDLVNARHRTEQWGDGWTGPDRQVRSRKMAPHVGDRGQSHDGIPQPVRRHDDNALGHYLVRAGPHPRTLPSLTLRILK